METVELVAGTTNLAFVPGVHANADRLREIAATASTGIDAATGLASDFLNQFNEVSMLLDMAADDAEMLEELEGWEARDYVSHFEASNFRDAALVLEAYALCPADIRERFDAMSASLGAVIAGGIAACGALEADAAGHASAALAADVRARIDALSAVIHPAQRAPSNTDISALFAARR